MLERNSLEPLLVSLNFMGAFFFCGGPELESSLFEIPFDVYHISEQLTGTLLCLELISFEYDSRDDFFWLWLNLCLHTNK